MRIRVLIGLALAIASSVASAAYMLTRSGSDGIDTAEVAVEATEPLLQSEIDDWRVTRVVLVRQASNLLAVTREIPPSGLGRGGFPGPVWVVIGSARLRCDTTSHRMRLMYIFEASSGRPLIVGGAGCHPFGPHPLTADGSKGCLKPGRACADADRYDLGGQRYRLPSGTHGAPTSTTTRRGSGMPITRLGMATTSQ